jgi:hypothetical protein
MLDSKHPVLHHVLRQWFFRQRIEESQLMRSALDTPENATCVQTFRNSAWNNQIDELQTISLGVSELFSPESEKDELARRRSALDAPGPRDLAIARASLKEQQLRLQKLADELEHFPPDADSVSPRT